MIRILQVVTFMGRGGLETMLMNYYRQMDRTKIQFDFLVHREFQAEYDEEILARGGKIYRFPRLIPWSKNYRRKLTEFLNEHKEYRIIHVHQDCLSAVALQCAREAGVPVRIGHSHTTSQNHNLRYFIKKYYQAKIPKYATDLFACGEKAGQWMFGMHEFQVLPNAVAVEQYLYDSKKAAAVKQELGLEGCTVVGHVGLFRSQKNHRFLLEIFRECVNRNDKMRLLLVGNGPLFDEIREQVRQLGLTSYVVMAGMCEEKNVQRLLQAMDVFVFPSFYEGVSLAMIEAQCAGLPCVISDTISEEGMLVKELFSVQSLQDTAKQWADQVFRMLKRERTSHMEEIVQAGYSIAHESKKLEAYYIEKYGS